MCFRFNFPEIDNPSIAQQPATAKICSIIQYIAFKWFFYFFNALYFYLPPVFFPFGNVSRFLWMPFDVYILYPKYRVPSIKYPKLNATFEKEELLLINVAWNNFRSNQNCVVIFTGFFSFAFLLQFFSFAEFNIDLSHT